MCVCACVCVSASACMCVSNQFCGVRVRGVTKFGQNPIIHIRCMHGIFGREITKYLVIYRDRIYRDRRIALYLPEHPLAEGISASDLEGMQGTVHNAPWQKINSEIWFCQVLAVFRSKI